jgi:hypothetical protein
VSERAIPRPMGPPPPRNAVEAAAAASSAATGGTREAGPQRSDRRAGERIGASGTTRLRVGGLSLLS